jgi:DNA-binding beta-propeller fold protein YncE
MTMKSNIKNLQGIRAIVSLVALVLIVELGFNAPTYAEDKDTLYIGDIADNTVKAFDAEKGDFKGEFVKKGNSPIKGPMGLIFNSDGDLLVSNQNAGANKPGELLKFDGKTGNFLGALVPHNDPNAPFAPRGIVLLKVKDVLFVASQSGVGKDAPPGNLLAYTTKGVFLADLTPDKNDEFPGAFSTLEFHPRGLVIGPDDLLYVSVCDDLDPKSANFDPAVTPLQGSILRFDPKKNGAFVDVFATYSLACPDLHRPEGLVFGPDGKLYVTAFRADKNDTDKILIFDSAGVCVDKIDLDQVDEDPEADQPRAFAQALLFGPGGSLFVPISGGGPDTGAVRRYNVSDKTFTNFVAPAAKEGPLGAGWYLTFGKTDPATLTYNP